MAQRFIETSFDYCENNGRAFFSSNEQKWHTKILRYKQQYPDEVIIKTMPKDNGGYIYAEIPQSWLNIRPPIRREFTDEQRAELSDRAKKLFARSTPATAET